MNLQLNKARENYKNGYYQEKLDQGLEFQDHVARKLHEKGIILNNYASKKYQYNHGENIFGAEIKRDGKFRETGNIYIETAEKASPEKINYTKSGIHRNDNSWLYIIGDEEILFIFSIKHLKILESKYKKVTTPTSKGFLMPLKECEEHCILKIEID